MKSGQQNEAQTQSVTWEEYDRDPAAVMAKVEKGPVVVEGSHPSERMVLSYPRFEDDDTLE